MRIEAWRMVKERHAEGAFTGEGAARVGGRWNSRGVAVVYASGTKALAALETLVHLNPPVFFRYVVFPLEFERSAVETVALDALPPEWRSEPPGGASQRVGDTWVRGGRSAVLAVPSVIIAGEWNYLLNPAHPKFREIRIGAPEPFAFDPRLLE